MIIFWKAAALVLTALSLAPGAAHLFELPNKIGLSRDAYFTVQGIYAGWALFGIVIVAAFAANLVLGFMLRRRDRAAGRLAHGSAALIAASLAVFFTWTFPANRATANWTAIPGHWQALRVQWEYSHAANAVIVFAAFVATALAASRSTPPPQVLSR